MLPVVVDKVGVHNNVKFVVLLDVYVEDNVPPYTLNTKWSIYLYLINSN